MIKDKKITALIPVRKGSKRVVNKNTRPFSDTNLLENKIKILQEVNELTDEHIDEILVTSDCPIAKSIAKKWGVSYVDREEYYASDECPGSKNLEYIAGQTNTEYVLFAPVTAPFVTSKTYSKVISKFKSNLDKHDSVVTVHYPKQFFWMDGKPLNYDPYDCPKSQDLSSVFSLTFGACLLPREKMIEKRYVVGDNPLWYELDDVESIDIDTEFDYKGDELLYEFGQKYRYIKEKLKGN